MTVIWPHQLVIHPTRGDISPHFGPLVDLDAVSVSAAFSSRVRKRSFSLCIVRLQHQIQWVSCPYHRQAVSQ